MSSAHWGPCEEAPRPRTSLPFSASGEQSEADEETETCHPEPGPCHIRASACPAGLCGLYPSSVPLGTMADSTTTLTFIVLLGLGVIPKPSIWADPGPIITEGSPVTIWCQGSLQASAYLMYKERGSEPWETRIPPNSSNKAGFLIGAMTSPHAGLYQCAYYTTGDILSERSDSLLLVVTGFYGAPSLSAQPGPVVASGGNVSLSCSSLFTWGTFHLLKEGGADPPQHMEAEPRIHAGTWQAIFPLGPVSPSHGGTYRCYGCSKSYPNVWSQPGAPLHIEVTAYGTQDYTVENLIRMGLAGLVLVVLGVLLFQAGNDTRKTHDAARMGTRRQQHTIQSGEGLETI
ncbi:leukocyte immunoglobulin-like receptor subfamily A member 5 isoform X2 [Eptesicus fuscus]|uniref:leukocyte immunoglobulin-like receptor subfamily A member 5 isoform X2 n=1 Tax=Eptesicus fuscus TaxID=29078 RepID=UPI0024043259|nr:leukocyte immunoglobulin-like receptor subfamily A member 5 isoform X2 [Eptesicus fuscus]